MVIFLKYSCIQFLSFEHILNSFFFFFLVAIFKPFKIASKTGINYFLTKSMQLLWKMLLSQACWLLLSLKFHFYYFRNTSFQRKSIPCFCNLYPSKGVASEISKSNHFKRKTASLCFQLNRYA